MKQLGFADLMPYGDDTNPLSVRINNPDLKVQLRHVLDTYFAWNSDSTDLSRWIGLNANVIQNSWGTRTSYNTKTGAFTYKSDNVNGNWDAKIDAGFSRSIGKSVISASLWTVTWDMRIVSISTSNMMARGLI